MCVLLDLIIISRVIKGKPAYLPLFAKPAIAAGLMGLGCWATYGLGSKLLMKAGMFCNVDEVTHEVIDLSRSGNALVTMAAIGVAVMIYGILVLALRAISKEDLKLMPKGEKIAKILHIS